MMAPIIIIPIRASIVIIAHICDYFVVDAGGGLMSSIDLSKSRKSLYRRRMVMAFESRVVGVTPRSSSPGRPLVGTLER